MIFVSHLKGASMKKLIAASVIAMLTVGAWAQEHACFETATYNIHSGEYHRTNGNSVLVFKEYKDKKMMEYASKKSDTKLLMRKKEYETGHGRMYITLTERYGLIVVPEKNGVGEVDIVTGEAILYENCEPKIK